MSEQSETAKPSLHGLRTLAFTYLGALGFAALISPFVYNGIQAWHISAPNGFTEEVADNSFDEYFDRMRWIWVLICLPWLVKSLGLRGWQASGLSFKKADWAAFGAYFLAGIGLLATVAAIRLLTAEFSMSSPFPDRVAKTLLNAILGGLLVAFLEEYVFRSLIWKAFSLWRAVLGGIFFASFFFAYTHYKMSDELWNSYTGNINIMAGLYVAWGTLIGFIYDASFLDFVNLCLLGVWLTLLRLRSDNLARSMGLHAGIVFALLTFVKLINVEETPLRFFFGGPGLRDGLVSFFVFLLGISIEWRKHRCTPTSAN